MPILYINIAFDSTNAEISLDYMRTVPFKKRAYPIDARTPKTTEVLQLGAATLLALLSRCIL